SFRQSPGTQHGFAFRSDSKGDWLIGLQHQYFLGFHRLSLLASDSRSRCDTTFDIVRAGRVLRLINVSSAMQGAAPGFPFATNGPLPGMESLLLPGGTLQATNLWKGGVMRRTIYLLSLAVVLSTMGCVVPVRERTYVRYREEP